MYYLSLFVEIQCDARGRERRGDPSRGIRNNKQVQVSDRRGSSLFIGVEIKHEVDRYPDWINLRA